MCTILSEMTKCSLATSAIYHSEIYSIFSGKLSLELIAVIDLELSKLIHDILLFQLVFTVFLNLKENFLKYQYNQ